MMCDECRSGRAVLTYLFDVRAADFGVLEKRRTVSVIYSARGISKRFGAVPALQGVDFDVVEGKVNGLVGANGAGKSTLLKIIAGALPPDAGEIKLDGRPLAMESITDAARAGIAIVSQELSLFPALNVEENLLLAPGKARGGGAALMAAAPAPSWSGSAWRSGLICRFIGYPGGPPIDRDRAGHVAKSARSYSR